MKRVTEIYAGMDDGISWNLYGGIMKKHDHKIVRIIGIILIDLTLIITLLIFIWINRAKPSTAIIGGADTPTLIFLLFQHKWIVLLALGSFITGICCIIISVFMNHRSKKKKD